MYQVEKYLKKSNKQTILKKSKPRKRTNEEWRERFERINIHKYNYRTQLRIVLTISNQVEVHFAPAITCSVHECANIKWNCTMYNIQLMRSPYLSAAPQKWQITVQLLLHRKTKWAHECIIIIIFWSMHRALGVPTCPSLYVVGSLSCSISRQTESISVAANRVAYGGNYCTSGNDAALLCDD